MDQKLAPLLASMTQHLEGLMGQRLDIKDQIHIQAVEYQRGMNYENSIIIIDEAQNLSEHEMFTLLTRACETSKIFICGDLTQCDDRGIKKNENSGLRMVINRLREADDEIIADVQFHKSHRKGISLLCVDRLGDVAQ
jgi:predicted ribonuclease YlaK